MPGRLIKSLFTAAMHELEQRDNLIVRGVTCRFTVHGCNYALGLALRLHSWKINQP